MTVEEAKKISIPSLWKHLNLEGEPAGSCRSPFRDDNSPSFFIASSDNYWKDYGTGEGGDALDMVMKALNLDFKEAIEYLEEVKDDLKFIEEKKEEKPKPTLPELSLGTSEDVQRLSKLRGLSIESLNWALNLGILRFVEIEKQRCWVVTDNERNSAQYRRLDGEKIGDSKAKTFSGSWASWPIGIGQETNGIIFLTEGGPDLLASIHLAHELRIKQGIRFACLLGATQRIHKEALERFKASKVLVFSHSDKAGEKAFTTWSEQLKPYAKKVIKFEKLFLTQNDLNDIVLLDKKLYMPVVKINVGKLIK